MSEQSERILANMEQTRRVMEALHERLTEAENLLKEFEDIYMATGYNRAFDELHNRIVDYLDKVGQ